MQLIRTGWGLVLAIGLLWPAASQAQQREGPWRKAANTAFSNSDYYSAAKYYQVLTEFDSTNTYYWLRLGQSAQEVNDYKLAEVAYHRALRLDAQSSYPNTAYYLAQIKHRLGKYDEARSFYGRFLAQQPNAPELLRFYAQVGVESCRWAPGEVAEARSWYLELASDSINTEFSEFGGFISQDTLWYSSYRFDFKDDEAWPKRKYFKVMQAVGDREGQVYSPLDTLGRHTGNPALSRDGSMLYYTICDYQGRSSEVRCDLYRRKRLNGAGWAAPERLSINTPGATTTEPCIGWEQSSGREILFFASDRAGGQGQMDIWYSYLDDQGDAGQPINLTALNTAGMEMSPYFHSASQHLFFSTDGKLTLGGMDVYTIPWTEVADPAGGDMNGAPENLGYPLNSSYDDLYFYLAPETNAILVSSNREGSTPYSPPEVDGLAPPDSLICCYDLWEGGVEVDLVARTFFDGTYYEEKIAPADTVYLYRVAPDGHQTLVRKAYQARDRNHYDLGKLQLFSRYKVVGFKRGFPVDSAWIDDLLTFEDMPRRDTTLQVDLKFLEYFDLQILTYQIEEGLRDTLHGCAVVLEPIGGDGTEEIQARQNPDGNDFQFEAKVYQQYIVTASRDYFQPFRDTFLITSELVEEQGQRISPTLVRIVAEVDLQRYPDSKIFFENNEPSYSRAQRSQDPRLTFAEDWPGTYYETYKPYVDKKLEHFDIYIAGVPPAEAENDSIKFFQFYNRSVEPGYPQLDSVMAPLILESVQKGDTVTLDIIGRTSPLGSARYNDALSKRRISSIINEFKAYRNGILLPYMVIDRNGTMQGNGNGQLLIETNPRGLKDAPPGVSASPRNRRESVYSPEASAERHVEVFIKKITSRDQKIIFQ